MRHSYCELGTCGAVVTGAAVSGAAALVAGAAAVAGAEVAGAAAEVAGAAVVGTVGTLAPFCGVGAPSEPGADLFRYWSS